ncbi:hypothetical protein B0J14DRAFT_656982 [Halenospora varia]|nr:hypothetical protein B0J14DRAFT_656982 [Halenospora varia]
MYITSILRLASIASLANNVYARSGAKFVTRDLGDINGFVYWGCFSAYDLNNVPFVLAGDLPSMTREICTAKCTDYLWTGIFESKCYCGFGFPYTPEPDLNIACNFPCPGNADEFCGGFNPNATRGSSWWSIYKQSGATTTTSSIWTSSSSVSSTSSVPSTSTAVTSPTIGTSGISDATFASTSTITAANVTSCDASIPSCTVGQVTTTMKSGDTAIPPDTRTKTTQITSQVTSLITSTQVVTNGTIKTSTTGRVVAPTTTPIQGNAVLLQAGGNSKELGLLVSIIGLLLLW